jgi:hypothetical protein
VLTSGNPDHIAAGVTVFIPRSEAGYSHLINKLKALQLQIQGSLDQERYLLEGDFNRLQANRVLFDFAGDVLTALATIGLQARKAAQVAEAAERVTGRGAVAAEYLAHKEKEKLSEMLVEKLVDTGLDAGVDHATEDASVHTKEGVKRTLEAGRGTRKAIKAVRNFSLQGGRFLLDCSEIVLDNLKVSTVADLWLKFVTGETPESSFESAQKRIGRAIANSTTQLHDKILYLAEERDLLYHSPQVGGPAANTSML